MAELFLIAVAIYWLATDTATALWVIGGALVLIFICALVSACQKTGKGQSRRPAERPRTRINVPHYYDADEYVCTICGTRFDTDTMTCPHCGVRFNHTETDDRAFIEEEDEEDWWDELEEEGR